MDIGNNWNMTNLRNTNGELRALRIFAGSDSFMKGGHQIINSNRARVGPKRKDADWAKSDKQVQKLLLRVFPKMAADEKQRMRAGRWLRVIQLYYRSGYSYGDAAIEIGINKKVVSDILCRISRALRGRPCSGKKKLRKLEIARTFLGDQ
jgi:hypothetical protein